MTFKCDGDSHCENSKKATVTVSFKDEASETFYVKKPPICVVDNPVNIKTDKKIFRFWAENYRNDGSPPVLTFEHYACGNNAYYQPDPKLENNGAYLMVDGNLQVGTSYYYWHFSKDWGGTRRFLDVVDEIPQGTSGDFSDCVLDGCEITIYDKDGNQIYKKKGESPCKVEVACDDNCPEGYLKCSSDKYPGYCCLPCKETANKIRSLGNKL